MSSNSLANESTVVATVTANVSVRAANKYDVKSIYRVHVNSIREVCSKSYSQTEIKIWSDRQSQDKYLRFMESEEESLYVAENPNGVIGFGHLGFYKAETDRQFQKTMEVKALYVAPEEVMKGIGRKILEEIERKAKECHCRELLVYSTLNAVGFYGHCGFIKREESYHSIGDGLSLKCHKMSKKLSDNSWK